MRPVKELLNEELATIIRSIKATGISPTEYEKECLEEAAIRIEKLEEIKMRIQKMVNEMKERANENK